MRRAILNALRAKYEAEIAEADATANIYLENSVGIGEHPQHIEEVDKLIEKIANQNVNCVRESTDQYGRTLAECFIGQESLSRFLVRAGYAFAYRKYSKKFIKDEEYAMKKGIGMWSTDFLFPWDFRKVR